MLCWVGGRTLITPEASEILWDILYVQHLQSMQCLSSTPYICPNIPKVRSLIIVPHQGVHAVA
jgi:predicted  nucleic acid-binding Zn ribbon protein